MTCRPIFLALVLVAPAASQDKKPKDPPPAILYAVPLVLRPGEKQTISLHGKKLDTATGITVDGPDSVKVKFLAAKKVPVPNNFPDRVGDSAVQVELELPKDIKPGQVALRVAGPNGVSDKYTLLVRDDLPAIGEKEPNDGFEQAQPITIPAAIEATIKGERDPDVFRFQGTKGDKLRIEVQAARFGSPVDALLMLTDADRRLIDSTDDTAGTPDPVLNVTLPRDGVYYLSVIDAHDLGGANFGYRLVVRTVK